MKSFTGKIPILTTIQFLLLMTAISCQQQEQNSSNKNYTIDKTLPAKLKKAESGSEMKGLSIDNCFWFFSDSLDDAEMIPAADYRKFYDTLSTYGDGVCDCMFKNDTVILQGGIAYEGGIGFDVWITQKDFNGKIWVAGEGYKQTADSLADFRDEMVLKSIHQTLKISDPKSLEPGKKLTGEIYMESEGFLTKNDPRPNKLFMKILFSCKLDEAIVF